MDAKLSPCALTKEDLSEELRECKYLDLDEEVYEWELDDKDSLIIHIRRIKEEA